MINTSARGSSARSEVADSPSLKSPVYNSDRSPVSTNNMAEPKQWPAGYAVRRTSPNSRGCAVVEIDRRPRRAHAQAVEARGGRRAIGQLVREQCGRRGRGKRSHGAAAAARPAPAGGASKTVRFPSESWGRARIAKLQPMTNRVLSVYTHAPRPSFPLASRFAIAVGRVYSGTAGARASTL